MTEQPEFSEHLPVRGPPTSPPSTPPAQLNLDPVLIKMWPLQQIALAAQTMYCGFTIHTTIPFDRSRANAAIPFTRDVHTSVEIRSHNSNRTFHPIIDTGTCGFVLSAADIPGWNKAEAAKNPVGWEFLSSSKILYAGHWIPTDVYFTNANVNVRARIPILAVEIKWHCPTYNKTTDRNVCHTQTDGPEPTVSIMPKGIQVLGVGHGRQHDGQPQGTPDKNAFINIQEIGDAKLPDNEHFRNGYIITKHGIEIGLTEENTKDVKFSKLSLREGTADPRDWAQVECCMAVDGAECTPGVALIDTGVAQMYMTLPLGTKVRRSNPPLLDNGSTVDVRFGSAEKYIASESFTVGDEAASRRGIAPSVVRMTLADPVRNPPHVNTGRHFLRAWKVAFDSDGGYFGFGDA